MSDEKPQQFTSSSKQWRKLKPLALHMRHNPTPAEDALWQKIRNRRIHGAKFRRQHAIEGFIVDFVCITHRLVIEVDGSIHDDPEQQAYDIQRQDLLESHGYHVLRFTNEQVLREVESVVEQIGETLLED